MERQAVKSESADQRLFALQREVSEAEDRLKRLYHSIEDGIVELDDNSAGTDAALKSQRERAKAALDRARANLARQPASMFRRSTRVCPPRDYRCGQGRRPGHQDYR
jgi:hypothetical protein